MQCHFLASFLKPSIVLAHHIRKEDTHTQKKCLAAEDERRKSAFLCALQFPFFFLLLPGGLGTGVK